MQQKRKFLPDNHLSPNVSAHDADLLGLHNEMKWHINLRDMTIPCMAFYPLLPHHADREQGLGIFFF